MGDEGGWVIHLAKFTNASAPFHVCIVDERGVIRPEKIQVYPPGEEGGALPEWIVGREASDHEICKLCWRDK